MQLPGRLRGTAPLPTVIGRAAILLCAISSLAAVSQKAATSDPRATALQEFQRRLNGYVELRTKLGHELQPLKPTANAAELVARQNSLAEAIRLTRKGARMGDLIPTPVAELLTQTVQSDFKNRAPETRRAAVSEVTDGVAPVINRTFPTNAPLPTIPPLLLAKLPLLPDNLQYRFLGRHLIILDGDTQLVIDYVANALPPH